MKIKKMNFLKRGFCFALSFLFVVGLASTPVQNAKADVSVPQQSQKVSGIVKDATGETLVGVNVVEIGTTNGTITDIDGKYSLDVKANATLQFTYIGYIPQTQSVTGSNLDVVLREDVQSLSEVVVVGYGTQTKKDITGSVAVIDTKDLLASSGSSAVQQLQGKAAGVFIGTSGAPGSQTMIRIRGINTINDNGVLFVIDGVSTRNQDLSSINPNDIESMQILKDASSAAIYGAQAANGVVLITTKKGSRSGQPVVSYDGYFGVQKTGKNYDVLNSRDRLQLEWDAKANNYAINGVTDRYPSHVQFGTGPNYTIPNYMTQAGANGSQNIDPNSYSYPDNTMVPFSDTNWWNEIDQAAPMQNHQISVMGGSDKGQYSLGANYYDQEGTVIDTYYKRYQVRANSTFNVRPWLRMGENFTYSWMKDLGRTPNGAEDSPYSWTYRSSPFVPVYDIGGNFAGSKIAGTGNWQNPVSIKKREIGNYWSNSRLFGNLWAEADLYKGLTFRTSFGMDYTNNYSYRMAKQNLEFSETRGRNNLEEQAGFNFRWVWSNTITYTNLFNDVHRVTVLAGTEAIRDGLGRSMTGQRYDYLYEDNENTWVLNMGEKNTDMRAESEYRGESAWFGIFARADYSFMDKYLFTGIVRRDGVSRFSESNRYGVFPSVSLGWRVSEEGFMESTRTWLDDMKLRVGYGQVGNAQVPRQTNFAYEFTTDPNRTNYDLSGTNTASYTGYRLQRFGNPDTKWEAVETTTVGLDATLLNGKFGVNLEWYSKRTTDMLLPASYSALAGEADKPYVNFGNMKNDGFDIALNYRDRSGDFSWDVNFIVSRYVNEVTKISDADDASFWEGGARISGNILRTTKGLPIASFYGYKLNGFYENADQVMALPPIGQDKSISRETAETYVGKFKFADTDGNGLLDVDDRTMIGNPHPDLFGSLNLGLGYKGFDFTMFWTYSIGNDMFNNTKYFTDFWLFEGNKSTNMRDLSWKAGADNSKAILPVLDYGDSYSGTNSSSYYVEDASYLRLKNLVIGYTFPSSLLKKATISNLRIYAQAENILTFTGYSGLDPEFSNASVGDGNASDRRRGLDMGGWPLTMRFLFGVNFAF